MKIKKAIIIFWVMVFSFSLMSCEDKIVTIKFSTDNEEETTENYVEENAIPTEIESAEEIVSTTESILEFDVETSTTTSTVYVASGLLTTQNYVEDVEETTVIQSDYEDSVEENYNENYYINKPQYVTQTLYTTNTEWGSWENIITSANRINEIGYIGPYESFSWLNDVGFCNEYPYVPATQFFGDENVLAIGGGICFPSTTLMQAVENAGMIVTEKHPHTRPVSYNERPDPDIYGWDVYYASLENEAAIDSDYGMDLKFYNPFPVGAYIYVYADSYYGSCTVTITPEE